jgi:hypothetical protein
VAVRGLALARLDQQQGKLSANRRATIKESVEELVDDLADYPDQRPAGTEMEPATASVAKPELCELAPEWQGTPVLCAAGRSDLDEAVALMLAQLLEKHGIPARVVPCAALSPRNLRTLSGAGVRLVCLSYLDIAAEVHARYMVPRLRRRLPGLEIVVGFWSMPDAAMAENLAERVGADAVATSLQQAVGIICERARAAAKAQHRNPSDAAAE